MRIKGKSWFLLVGVLVGMAGVLAAAEFAPPADGPVAFRRDRIPLEQDAMAELSTQLEVLAGGLDAKAAADRRRAAQMLALALALNPGNAEARKRIADYRDGRHQPAVDGGRLEAIRGEIREVVAWLASPAAGKDGQALAACLEDLLATSEAGEKGAWAGWIPELSAYEEKKAVAKAEPAGTTDKAPAIEKKKILLKSAEVRTPMWQRVGSGTAAKWVLAPAALGMSAREVKDQDEGQQKGFNIVIGHQQGAPAQKQLGRMLSSLLRKAHGELPQGVQVAINSKEFSQSLQSKKEQSISAAAAVLASGAITGREPAAIIIGQVDENGAFTLPSRFWYQLQALGPGAGQRVVLPAEAAAFMPSILAMEKPEFFFEYEVVLAADFEQLLAFAAKTPEGPLAAASTKFREIRERKGQHGLRTYIQNGFVKQRLAAVLQDMPTHVSAKMLLMQASGDRPVWVSRRVLAAELRRALEAVPSIKTAQLLAEDSEHSANVGDIYENCRASVEALNRYTAMGDRDLLDDAREVTTAIRSLEKATRSRDQDYLVNSAVRKAHADLRRLHKALDQKLAIETGDAGSTIKP